MTAVDELIAFVRQQLDEDERLARAATSGPWRVAKADSVYVNETSVVMGGHDGNWYIVPFQGEGGEGIEPGDALHIARWDPARVLAEVEAKRRILDAHGQPHECIALTGSGDRSVVDGQPWALWELGHTEDDGPCFVVRMLAQPYAGREGWQEEWAV